jgi:Fe-S-cluster containining protein
MYAPLEYLKKNRKRRKQLRTFLRGLFKRKVRGLDAMAIGFHKEVSATTDCLKCANCCKTMTPTWKKAEVKRVAARTGTTYKEYFKKYLYYDESGDLMNKKNPCQHLLKNNMCAIYDIRPIDCSGFPHTHSRDFKLYISSTHIQNLDYCPITVGVVEKMFEKIVEGGKNGKEKTK